MGRKGAEYERELKGLLMGDSEIIDKICRAVGGDVCENYRLLINNPFIVVRAAGSFGIDLIAIREDISFPIEVKVSSAKRISFSHSHGRAQLQYEEFKKICSSTGVLLIYAYRLKRAREDPWRIFSLDCEPTNKRLRLIYDFLPKLEHTSYGHVTLYWEKGKPLNEFIRFLMNEVLK